MELLFETFFKNALFLILFIYIFGSPDAFSLILYIYMNCA